MKSTMLQYDKAVEMAVNRLIEMGIFKSKADVFRAGAMELAVRFGAVKSRDEIIEEMMFKDSERAYKKLKSGKAKVHSLNDL